MGTCSCKHNGALQRSDFERVQKQALRIIVPEYEYNRTLHECGLKTLQQRREDLYEFVI